MKKKMLLAIAAVMVFGLSIAAFAFTTTTLSSATAVSRCCCTGDSCPMKKKDASGKETASCCDGCDCCTGDSCPMRKSDHTTMTGVKMADGASCPMKMKADSASGPSADAEDTKAEAKSGDCPCCSKDKEKKDTSAV